jgi:hypothetical protein
MSYLGEITKTRDPLVNYITNGRAYNNATGWNTYADAAGAQPVDGTGGSPNITFSRNTTSPLRQASDFRLVKDAANRQGQGVSYDFTVDNADLATVLTVSFDYSVISGTYADGNLTIYLIQDPSGTPVVIQPAGYTIMSATAGIPMRAVATFQTASNVSSYRLCLHIASTTTSAFTLAFDNVSVSSQTIPIGPVVTDWVSWTPTGTFTTNVTYSGLWRRVGDSMEVQFRVNFSGVTNAATFGLNLPSGYSADLSKISGAALPDISGSAEGFRGSTGYAMQVVLNNSTSIFLAYISNGTTSAQTSVTNFLPVAWALGDQINGTFRVPIQGWSSSVQMSNDTDTRVVSLSATRAQAAVTAGANITGFTTLQDTHGAFNASTGIYTIPVTGDYVVAVSGALPLSGSSTVSTIYDGSGVVFTNTATAGATRGGSSALLTGLPAGKTISFRSDTSVTFTNEFRISIHRLSGPSVIAATENVIAKYSTTAGQSITSTPATIVYATREIDSHGIVNTTNGNITIPISGKYLIGVYGSTASATFAAGQQFLFQIRKNGSFSSFINQIRAQTAYTGILESVGPTYIDCLAGDVLNIQAQCSVATTLRTTTGTNFFYLVRLGN